jgi:hypothetical protein
MITRSRRGRRGPALLHQSRDLLNTARRVTMPLPAHEAASARRVAPGSPSAHPYTHRAACCRQSLYHHSVGIFCAVRSASSFLVADTLPRCGHSVSRSEAANPDAPRPLTLCRTGTLKGRMDIADHATLRRFFTSRSEPGALQLKPALAFIRLRVALLGGVLQLETPSLHTGSRKVVTSGLTFCGVLDCYRRLFCLVRAVVEMVIKKAHRLATAQ